MYLKVSPMRRLKRFGVKGKLSTRYIGPFRILAKKGEVSYQLELPEHLFAVHDVFHVSQLKKCLRGPEEQLPMEDLEIEDDLTYTEYLPRSWKLPRGGPETEQSECVKSGGTTTQRIRQLGNERTR